MTRAKKTQKAEQKTGGSVRWQDRVKELRRVPASQLKMNPKNWREHPESQQRAIEGILDEIGIASALLARETPEGLQLIDGHLRTGMDDDTEWPVIILDVTEAEADVLLASMDPIGAMALQSDAKLLELLGTIQVGSEKLGEMLDRLGTDGLANIGAAQRHDEKYSRKVEAPVYEPKGNKPKLVDLYDTSATDKLLARIRERTEPGPLQDFLTHAARRHTSFQYDQIAEFYAHADADVQRLMEESALVIIDFDQAIELGFVNVTKGLQDLWAADHEE